MKGLKFFAFFVVMLTLLAVIPSFATAQVGVVAGVSSTSGEEAIINIPLPAQSQLKVWLLEDQLLEQSLCFLGYGFSGTILFPIKGGTQEITKANRMAKPITFTLKVMGRGFCEATINGRFYGLYAVHDGKVDAFILPPWPWW